jgi:hypothetical protein
MQRESLPQPAPKAARSSRKGLRSLLKRVTLRSEARPRANAS